jgi:predicted membrane channel-forming protein YqfA (hemolysin III family)
MYDEYDWTMAHAAVSITPICAIYTAIAYAGSNTHLQSFANFGMLSTLFLYVASSAFYKGKLPERYVRLDWLNYIGNSHQIFHVLSALGFYMGFAATGYFPAIERSLSTG